MNVFRRFGQKQILYKIGILILSVTICAGSIYAFVLSKRLRPISSADLQLITKDLPITTQTAIQGPTATQTETAFVEEVTSDPLAMQAEAGDPIATSENLMVIARIETDPVISSGDAADDPAIWVHPSDPSKSTIIGTDKKAGLAVYDLSGKTLQYRKDGGMDNVDLRYNFPLSGENVDIVTAGNKQEDTLAIYKVNAITRKLEKVNARKITTGIPVYGSCMYYSIITGKYYVFINSEKKGGVQQWELFDNGAGKVDAKLVRQFEVGSVAEGCVADDELGYFYIAEENVGIWRYGAEPEAGAERVMVAPVVPNGKLTPDAEGLAIYYAKNGKGYLIASSQGSNEFVIYDRAGNNDYLLTFDIQAKGSMDGASSTDGIDVANINFGPLFPQGFFIVQDGNNKPDHQNFKLIPWPSIAELVKPSLIVDPSWNPRSIGAKKSGQTLFNPSPPFQE
jgi:3-phytase